MKKYLVPISAGVMTATLHSAPAYAYLDPGTGSIILQLLLGGVAGALVIFKLYWARLKSFFVRKPANQERNDDSEGS